jgi:hypothetical protein
LKWDGSKYACARDSDTIANEDQWSACTITGVGGFTVTPGNTFAVGKYVYYDFQIWPPSDPGENNGYRGNPVKMAEIRPEYGCVALSGIPNVSYCLNGGGGVDVQTRRGVIEICGGINTLSYAEIYSTPGMDAGDIRVQGMFRNRQ